MIDGEIRINDGYHTQLSIGGKIYDAKLSWSITDFKFVLGNIEALSEADCKEFMKNLIARAINVDINDGIIRNVSESDCKSFVDEFFKYKPEYRVEYDSLSDKSVAKKFFLACKDRAEIEVRECADIFAQGLIRIREKLNEFSNVIVESFASTARLIESVDLLPDFEKQINAIRETVSRAIYPQIDEQEKQELFDLAKKWGEYGWTSIPDKESSIFMTDVSSLQSANKMAISQLDDYTIELLFSELGSLKSVKKSDLSELRACYANHLYKAACMIAFGMIDCKLIRSQPKTGKWRETGCKAAEITIKKIKEKKDLEGILYVLLDAHNILACMETIFANGNDFIMQPKIINRNFVNHGMLYRTISRTDALKAILLTYNVYRLFELFY